MRRARPLVDGLYTLPGGGVELGETLEEAVIREVREETSLDVEPVALAGYRRAITRDAAGVELISSGSPFAVRCIAGEVALNEELAEPIARTIGALRLADHRGSARSSAPPGSGTWWRADVACLNDAALRRLLDRPLDPEVDTADVEQTDCRSLGLVGPAGRRATFQFGQPLQPPDPPRPVVLAEPKPGSPLLAGPSSRARCVAAPVAPQIVSAPYYDDRSGSPKSSAH